MCECGWLCVKRRIFWKGMFIVFLKRFWRLLDIHNIQNMSCAYNISKHKTSFWHLLDIHNVQNRSCVYILSKHKISFWNLLDIHNVQIRWCCVFFYQMGTILLSGKDQTNTITSFFQHPDCSEENGSAFLFVCDDAQQLKIKFQMSGKHKICKSAIFCFFWNFSSFCNICFQGVFSKKVIYYFSPLRSIALELMVICIIYFICSSFRVFAKLNPREIY